MHVVLGFMKLSNEIKATSHPSLKTPYHVNITIASASTLHQRCTTKDRIWTQTYTTTCNKNTRKFIRLFPFQQPVLTLIEIRQEPCDLRRWKIAMQYVFRSCITRSPEIKRNENSLDGRGWFLGIEFGGCGFIFASNGQLQRMMCWTGNKLIACVWGARPDNPPYTTRRENFRG